QEDHRAEVYLLGNLGDAPFTRGILLHRAIDDVRRDQAQDTHQWRDKRSNAHNSPCVGYIWLFLNHTGSGMSPPLITRREKRPDTSAPSRAPGVQWLRQCFN